MSATPNPKTAICQTLRVPAGGLARIDVEGDFYHVVEANFQFELMRTGMGFAPVQQGDSEELPPDQVYRILDIRNPATNGAELVVTIYAGYGRRNQSRQSVMETPSEAAGNAAVSIAAGATVTLLGTPTGNRIRRKSVLVVNFDLANPLLILDELGLPFSACLPGTAWIRTISGPVGIKNASGGDISCIYGEEYYTTR